MIKWLKQVYNSWKYKREKAKYAKSDEPWVYIKSDVVDPVNGLKLDVDWNEAFIKYLRAQGVKGTKDEDVVSYWLTMINAQLMDSLEPEDDE